MRTVCPSCQAAYDVPASVIAAGRTLRCARCNADFTPEQDLVATASEALAPAQPQPEPAYVPLAPGIAERDVHDEPREFGAPAPMLPKLSEPPVNRRAVMAAWITSVVFLGTLTWALVIWRTPIMQAWPASERLYAALNLT